MSNTRATISIHLSAAVEQVFKIGSMEPGAMLFDASKEFEVSNASLSLGKRLSRLPEPVADLGQGPFIVRPPLRATLGERVVG